MALVKGRVLHGVTLPDHDSTEHELVLRLFAFREATDPEEKYLALMWIVDCLWIAGHSKPLVQIHPYLERALKAMCSEKVVALGGAGGVGKSFGMAIYALVFWLADPVNTIVLVTSTSITAARQRVWGDLASLFRGSSVPLPGNLVEAFGKIRSVDQRTNKQAGKHGIHLISCGTNKDNKSALSKMIGMHAKRVLVCGDELSELPLQLPTTVLSNLQQGTETFQFAAASNPNSRYDAFGVLAEPDEDMGGWEGLGDDTHHEGWRTRVGGVYLRLAAHDSPNLGFPENKAPFSYLPTQADIDRAARTFGAQSATYRRFILAAFQSDGEKNSIISEMEMLRARVFREPSWKTTPVTLMGVDLSFTSGGDASLACIAQVGTNSEGRPHFHVKQLKMLKENIRDKEATRSEQIAKKIADTARENNITPENIAIDATGAGSTFADLLRVTVGRGIHAITFAGAASMAPASATDKTPAKERYRNRASELAFGLRELISDQQVTMISDQDLRTQMVQRTFDMGSDRRLQIQPKTEYRQAYNSSPDHLDSVIIAIDLAKVKHRLVPATALTIVSGNSQTWKQKIRKYDVVARSNNFLESA